MAFFLSVAFAATDAGRVGESGTGAMWIAPELVTAAPAARPCSQPTALQARDLVFETLEVEDIDAELPRQLATASHEVVAFEWNAATGELSYTTSADAGVFSDLASSLPASARSGPSCGSR
jgi:hypothetical protein